MELKTHWMADLLPQMPEKEFEDLKEDIAGLGQLEPILVFNGEILDGRHRYRACKELEIEPWVQEFEGGMSLSDVIRSLNVYRRHLTASQRAMVAAELMKPYEEQAKKNQIESGGNRGNQHTKKLPVREILPEPPTVPEPEIIDITPEEPELKPEQRATDMAAEDWGVSGRSVRDAKVIVDNGTDEERESVKTGKSSVSSTAKDIRDRKKKTSEIRPPAPKKMNFTNDNIKWAKWTWNPVTGCLHGCPYCYAKEISNRYEGHFDPAFHEDRLSAPANTKIPENKKDIFGIDTVFVCSMADLFGEWVHPEWIQAVIDVCREQSQWTYLFLTKNPTRYNDFTFPTNCWIGASATNQKQFDDAISAFSEMDNGNIKFLSFEPLQEKIIIEEFTNLATHTNELVNVDWVIVGGQSAANGVKSFQPRWSWVEDIFNAARMIGTAVYFKDNLKVKPEEYPKPL